MSLKKLKEKQERLSNSVNELQKVSENLTKIIKDQEKRENNLDSKIKIKEKVIEELQNRERDANLKLHKAAKKLLAEEESVKNHNAVIKARKEERAEAERLLNEVRESHNKAVKNLEVAYEVKKKDLDDEIETKKNLVAVLDTEIELKQEAIKDFKRDGKKLLEENQILVSAIADNKKFMVRLDDMNEKAANKYEKNSKKLKKLDQEMADTIQAVADTKEELKKAQKGVEEEEKKKHQLVISQQQRAVQINEKESEIRQLFKDWGIPYHAKDKVKESKAAYLAKWQGHLRAFEEELRYIAKQLKIPYENFRKYKE